MLNVVDIRTVDYVNSGMAKAIKIWKLKAMTEIYEYGLKRQPKQLKDDMIYGYEWQRNDISTTFDQLNNR
jgi:hypothetical protein